MTISDRIKVRMSALKIKASDLARITGTTRGSVSQWVNDVSQPSGKNLIALAEALQCDPNWLLFGDENGLPVEAVPVMGVCPLIDWSDIAEWPKINIPENAMRIPCPVKCSNQAFVLRVKGVSMEPQFNDGDLIFVDPLTKAQHGKSVLAKFDSEVIFRQLMLEGQQAYVRPLNPNFPASIVSIKLSDILGVVIFAGKFV